ncbi:hypothetical protein F5B20DRAFT_540619 [Whalleya microplaca]|nr:hypothetical protein F5B20DRAFT_540619 [Whalleya microplaca]
MPSTSAYDLFADSLPFGLYGASLSLTILLMLEALGVIRSSYPDPDHHTLKAIISIGFTISVGYISFFRMDEWVEVASHLRPSLLDILRTTGKYFLRFLINLFGRDDGGLWPETA